MDIGVVLSGGGARCFAQVGVLRALEEYGFTPKAISSCSASAIIGALHAAGHKPARIQQIFEELSFSELLDINLDSKSGMIGFEGLYEALTPYLPETFEELAYPVAAVAVDVQNGQSYVFRSGPLLRGLLASNAFPGIFSPVEDSGRYLIDGGTLNIVPVDIIRTLTTLPVIAVDVTLPVTRQLELEDSGEHTLWNKIASSLSPQNITRPLELIEKAFTITQGRLAQLMYAMHPPDYIIRPPLAEDMMPQDFGRMNEAITCGYDEALGALRPERLPELLRA